MASTRPPRTPRSPRAKKFITATVILLGLAFVVGGIGYAVPGPIQMPFLLVGYFCLYIGIIVALYGLYQTYLSPAAEKADKAKQAAADAAGATPKDPATDA